MIVLFLLNRFSYVYQLLSTAPVKNWFAGILPAAYTHSHTTELLEKLFFFCFYLKWELSTPAAWATDSCFGAPAAAASRRLVFKESCILLFYENSPSFPMKEREKAWHQSPSVRPHHQWRPLGFPPGRWRRSRRGYLWSAASLQDRDRQGKGGEVGERSAAQEQKCTNVVWSKVKSTDPESQASCWIRSGRKCDNLAQPWAGKSLAISPTDLERGRDVSNTCLCGAL